jgi:acyl-[acyl-carrier-protein] desaturase
MATRIELEPSFSERTLLQSEPVLQAVATAYDHHYSAGRNQPERIWLPQEAIPFAVADEPLKLDDATLSALYVNGLTEDNLPFYTETIFRMFGECDALTDWAKRWTMEESRHGRTIERHQERNELFDTVWIEAMRRVQIEGGIVPAPPNAFEGAVYVTIQEEATRLPHSRVSGRLKKAGDTEGSQAYGLIAGDEAGHHRFYKTVALAMREVDPDYFIVSLFNQARNFAMPGTGITGFHEHADLIAAAGIFDVADLKNIISKLSLEFDIENLQLTRDESKRAQAHFLRLLRTFDSLATKHTATRERYEAGEYQAPVTWEEGKPVFINQAAS